MNKIFEISKTYKFQLKGIKYPVSSLYYDKIKKHDMNAEEVFLFHDIETINLQKELSFSDDKFKDPDHLNKKGSQLFLEELKKKLIIK